MFEIFLVFFSSPGPFKFFVFVAVTLICLFSVWTCVCGWGETWAFHSVFVEVRGELGLQSVLPFHQVGPWDLPRVIGLGSRLLYPLNHLASPPQLLHIFPGWIFSSTPHLLYPQTPLISQVGTLRPPGGSCLRTWNLSRTHEGAGLCRPVVCVTSLLLR